MWSISFRLGKSDRHASGALRPGQPPNSEIFAILHPNRFRATDICVTAKGLASPPEKLFSVCVAPAFRRASVRFRPADLDHYLESPIGAPAPKDSCLTPSGPDWIMAIQNPFHSIRSE